VLGVGFGVSVAVGNTIGVGILRAPGEVAAQVPHAGVVLAVWAAGGVYALVGAAQIAELGTMFPRSGGQYVFTRHALGDYAGFLVGWSDWLSTCGTTAAVSIVAAEFSAMLAPSVADRGPLLAMSWATAFAALQWRGIQWGRTVQNLTSAIKAVAFVAIAASGFLLGAPEAGTIAGGAPPLDRALMFAPLLLALQAVIYTYDGWTAPVYFSEEVADPGRAVPRALFAGVLAVAAIYLLLNLSLLWVLPVSAIAGEPFAAGVLAEQVFGRNGNAVLTAIVILAMPSAINAYHLMASRVLFAMARDGLFWRRAATVNPGGTPAVALLSSTVAALLFILVGGTFTAVISVLAFFFVANYTLSFVSVFVLRWREPDRERPHRAWGYPLSTAVALGGSLAFLAGAVAADPRSSGLALVLLAASYPMFRLVRSALPPNRNA
jgi:APA family basic amino acid/polyamine antiporter